LTSPHSWAAAAFARNAGDYERARPGYPATAVSFLARRLELAAGRTVVDVGAGTGKLTRLLLAAGAHVIAVEPVGAMRDLLPAAVEALAGTAESLPLAAGVADAVTIAQAFHWFDLDRSLPEIRRVLRADGRLAVLSNRRDPDDAVQSAFAEVLFRHRAHPSLELEFAAVEALDRSGIFTVLEREGFPFVHELPAADIVALAASESSIALLEDDDRAAALDDFARLAENQPDPVRLRYVTDVVVAALR
jgi:SAM-dependent methyltransferase